MTMRTPSAPELLSIWERGQGCSPVEKALLLLAETGADPAPEALPIGRRDALLLRLREQLKGSRVSSVAACPRCSREMELGFAIDDVRAAAKDDSPEPLTLRASGYEVSFRLPTSEDLAAIARGAEGADSEELTQKLLARCLLQVRRRGRKRFAWDGKLPSDLVAAIAKRMEEADPQANVRLRLSCADCGHSWSMAFDVAGYLWGEIDQWARRLLQDVHVLASAYGWREADVLSLSPRRRDAYLQMLGAR